MSFPLSYKSRAWTATIQIANMLKAKLTEAQYKDPEFLGEFIRETWENSGQDRSAAVAVCLSANGLYHAHAALYGNITTLKNVASIMFDSHVEPQLGGKKELRGYLLKEPPYDEKGEDVLYTCGIENVQDVQGHRTDMDKIADMIEQGMTPKQIEKHFPYRRYDKMIKAAYVDKRIDDTPTVKTMTNTWIVGESGTGKSYTYTQLCKEHGRHEVYLVTDHGNGGFDRYMERGAPPILFIDEFKGNMLFEQLLQILDVYSDVQIHCRYSDCYALWTKVFITSIYPPEEVYKDMVEHSRQDRDNIAQLLRRLTFIEYRYKKGEEYRSFSIPASEYINYADLKRRAYEQDAFEKLDDSTPVPFETE